MMKVAMTSPAAVEVALDDKRNRLIVHIRETGQKTQKLVELGCIRTKKFSITSTNGGISTKLLCCCCSQLSATVLSLNSERESR